MAKEKNILAEPCQVLNIWVQYGKNEDAQIKWFLWWHCCCLCSEHTMHALLMFILMKVQSRKLQELDKTIFVSHVEASLQLRK